MPDLNMVVIACVQEVQEVQHLLVVLERVIFDVAMAGTRPEAALLVSWCVH